jgi:hypothetical protein
MAVAVDQANLGANAINGGSSGTSISCTTGVAAAAAATIFVIAQNWDASAVPSSVSDGTHTYEMVGSVVSQGNERMALFRAYSSGGLSSGSTITANFTATTFYRRVTAFSFTGVNSGALADVLEATATGNGSGTAVDTADINTTQTCLILRVSGTDGAATMTWDEGTEILDITDGAIGGTKVAWSESASGTYDASGTLSTSNAHADRVTAIKTEPPPPPNSSYVFAATRLW